MISPNLNKDKCNNIEMKCWCYQAQKALERFCGMWSLSTPSTSTANCLKVAYTTKYTVLFIKALEKEEGKPETRRVVSSVLADSKQYGCSEPEFPPVLWAKIQKALSTGFSCGCTTSQFTVVVSTDLRIPIPTNMSKYFIAQIKQQINEGLWVSPVLGQFILKR
eukprot:4041397-Amphidinium_carterae.1